MNTRPILFSGPMVRALLDGRKTQTRRIVKQTTRKDGAKLLPELLQKIGIGHACPYGRPGDLLWVRESLRLFNTVHLETGEHGLAAYYAAGGGDMQTFVWNGRSDTTGIPSIHMPRWASRLTLELTEMRVERLQEISEEEALAEGCVVGKVSGHAFDSIASLRLGGTYWANARDWYADLWESINGPGSWPTNPWVWVLSFRVHQQNVDAFLKERERATHTDMPIHHGEVL